MLKFIFILLMLAYSLPANALLFGPKDYEECMNDGKVGRTSAELNELRKYCRKKFPQEKPKYEYKLPKLYKTGNSKIACVIDAYLLEIEINQKRISISGNYDVQFMMRDDSEYVFRTEHDNGVLIWTLNMQIGHLNYKYYNSKNTFSGHGSGKCTEAQ